MPDITSPTFKADPFPYHAQLRRQSPVHEVTPSADCGFFGHLTFQSASAIVQSFRY